MSDRSLATIAVVGGGFEAWLSAVFLAGQVAPAVKVVLVETPEVESSCASASSTLPLFRTFNRLLGADEKTLLRHSKGTFKLASTYAGWNPRGQGIFSVPFSNHGFMLNGIDFSQYVCALGQGHPDIAYNQFSVAAMAAQNGKFQHPVSEVKSLLHQLDYSYHLDLVDYKKWLRQQVKATGLSVVSSDSVSLNCLPDDGIETLSLSDGHRLDADIFIDASGSQALLFSQLANAGAPDDLFSLFNAVVEFESPERNLLSAETRYITLANGLLKKIPLQDRDVYQFYYHSDFSGQAKVAAEIESVFKRNDLALRFRPFSCTQKGGPWLANCIAVGQSFCRLEPFFVSSLDLLCLALMRLLDLLPATTRCAMNRSEFNRMTAAELSNIKDYHQLFYHCLGAAKRQGWNSNPLQLSDRFQQRLGLFEQCGKLPVFEDEIVSMDNWYSVLLQTGQWPDGFDPLVEGVEPDWVLAQLKKMTTLMARAVASMPDHDRYLSRLLRS